MATDNKEGQSETEDIPSDFFDDFNKEEFIEGLSVIDSWDDDGGKRRINAETVESVKDLRELIRDGKPERREQHSGGATSLERNNRSHSQDLNRFIKPGSRRDPEKTNEAIKRDKDMKVKEYLAKSLESSDDIRPPGTELDDFFDPNSEKKKTIRKEEKVVKDDTQARRSRSPRERRARESPPRPREPLYRPRRMSPPHRRESPLRRRESPNRHKESPPRRRELSPRRRESPRRSGFRKSRSPIRVRRFTPPRRSPRRIRRSRSPYGRSPDRRRSRSRSPAYHRSPNRDNFLYPESKRGPPRPAPYSSSYPQPYGPPQPHWEGAPPGEYPTPVPGYPYPAIGPPQAGPAYTGVYGGYDYSQPQPPGMPPVPGVPASGPYTAPGVPAPAPYPAPGYMQPAPVPQPVPAPVPAPVLQPPAMVPAPIVPPAAGFKSSQVENSNSKKTPYDALAQLVADGKISKEDYLKLTPNKGVKPSTPMELKEKVEVLSRCNSAVSKLASLHLPNKLVMLNQLTGPEPKVLMPKFCSPLKRQPLVEFYFTQMSTNSAAQRNKELIDSIVATVGLDRVVSRPRRRDRRDTKDVACQTVKPFCEACEIREATISNHAGTSIDPEHFCSSVHTQVVEQDLVSSKSHFTPGGGAGGATMSIAHMTPAQLVSQLAARAKTLKQPDPEPAGAQYMRRPQNNYDYDRGNNQYHNYGNYRY